MEAMLPPVVGTHLRFLLNIFDLKIQVPFINMSHRKMALPNQYFKTHIVELLLFLFGVMQFKIMMTLVGVRYNLSHFHTYCFTMSNSIMDCHSSNCLVMLSGFVTAQTFWNVLESFCLFVKAYVLQHDVKEIKLKGRGTEAGSWRKMEREMGGSG